MNDFILLSPSTLSKIKDGSVPNDLADDRRKKVEKMPSIIHLGFVIRHDAKVTENIIAACIAQLGDKGKTAWKAYPRGDQAFIPMLFVTSVLVKQRLASLADPENGMAQGEIILKKPNPCFDFILNHLFDVWTKRASYKSLPPDLRKAMKFFFELHGQKATAQLRAPKDGLRPSQIFFWTVRDYIKQTNLQLPKAPITVSVKKVPPQSNPYIILRIHELAEKVRLNMARPKLWQELYRTAAKPPEVLPVHRIILYGSKIDPTKPKSEQRLHNDHHLQLSQMMIQNKGILLTGPSGSGKTTILAILNSDLLGPRPPIPKCLPIFLSLKDVGLNGKNVTDLIVDSVAKQILNCEQLKTSLRQQFDIRRALHNKVINLESLLTAEIREFFKAKVQKSEYKIALFLDGYNEIREAEKDEAEKEIKQLAKNIDKMIVSTHSYGAQDVLSDLIRFELEELLDEQIIDYLNLQFEGIGEQFFYDKITSDGRILSMARLPLYLELIVEYHKTYPRKKLPTCPGPLLRFFVQKQYKKKSQVIKSRFPDVTKPDVDFFLRKIAHRLVNKSEAKAETVLSYPDDLEDIFSLSTIPNSARIAKAAELVGLLNKSGQISEGPNEETVISFKYDNIRDYFAAREFEKQKVFDNLAQVQHYLEYTKWDNVWLMLFGIIENEKEFERALSNVVRLDPCFATECLLASPIAKRKHSDNLLSVFNLSKIHVLLGVRPLTLREPSNGDFGFTQFEIVGPALSRIYSHYPAEHLVHLFLQPSTNRFMKAQIPLALLYRCRENAVDYLEQIIRHEGPKCHDEVFHFVSLCKNVKAYELLAEGYIKVIREDREDLDLAASFIFIFANYKGHVPIQLLLKLVNRCRKNFNNPDWPSDVPPESGLVVTLTDGLAGNAQDWLKLRGHPNRCISSAARRALLRIRHPVIMKEIADKCREGNLEDFDSSDTIYLDALAELNTSDTCELLLRLLERAVQQAAYWSPFVDIPQFLLKRGNLSITKRLIRLGLLGTDQISFQCLYWSAMVASPETKRIILSETNMEKANSEFQRCYAIARGLCGDKTANKYLIANLKDLRPLLEKPLEFPPEQRQENLMYFNCICDALIRLKASDCLPILEEIEKNSPGMILKSHARNALNHFKDIKCRYSKQGISELIKKLKSNPNKWDESTLLYHNLLQIVSTWPLDKRKKLLIQMRDITEEAIENSHEQRAQLFYSFTEGLRQTYGIRRLLDVFSGWPVIPSSKRTKSPNIANENCQ